MGWGMAWCGSRVVGGSAGHLSQMVASVPHLQKTWVIYLGFCKSGVVNSNIVRCKERKAHLYQVPILVLYIDTQTWVST